MNPAATSTIVQTPSLRLVRRRPLDESDTAAELNLHLPKRRPQPIAGSLAHRLLAGPVAQEARAALGFRERRERGALGWRQQLVREPVNADAARAVFDVHTDATFARDADQRDAFGVRDVEVDPEIAIEVRPAARIALDRHGIGREPDRSSQNRAQRRTPDDVALREPRASVTRRACVLFGGEPGREARDLVLARRELHPPRGNAVRRGGELDRRLLRIARVREIVYAHSRFSPMVFILRSLGRLPLTSLYGVARCIYFVTFRVLRWRRDLAARNIARSFPEKSEADHAAILEQSYRNMSEVFVELLWGWRASAEQLKDRMAIDNPELVARFVAEKRSVILLTAHVCNWEWLLPGGGAHFGIPIDAVYKPIRVASLDTYMRDARSRFGGQPIPIKSFAFELLRRAGQPRAYGLVADQTPLKSMDKHWARFLNQDTAFFVGAEKIARFLEAPVVLCRDAAGLARALRGASTRARRAAVRGRRARGRRCRHLDHRGVCAQARGRDQGEPRGLALGAQ